MSGALVLSGDPSAALGAATKGYADGKLGGLAIDSSALSSIANNQVLGWNSASSKWAPLTVVGAADATALQGTNIDSGAPTTAKVLVYDTAVASKWAAATLGAASLASDAVTTVKILDSNVTTAKFASSSVTAAVIGSDAVTTTKILDSNVTTAKFASSSVTAAVIGSDAVTTTKILDANVTAAKLANSTLTSIQVSATGGIPIYAVASLAATATIGAGQTVILANATAAGFTLTLPLFASVGNGQVYTIKKTDSTTNVVTISRNGTDPTPGTIEGSTSITLSDQYDTVQLATDGSNWYRINGGLKSWKLIKRTTVSGAAASSISIAGLDGDTDVRYIVKIHLVGAGGNAGLFLRPNGDDTLANFYRAALYGTTGGAVGGTGANDSAGAFWGGPATWTLQDCVIEIFAKTGAGNRTFNFDCIRNDGSAYAITWSNFWTDTTNNLTSLSFSANTNMSDQGVTNAVAAYGIGTTVDVYALR